MNKPKEETKATTLVELFNATFAMNVERMTLDQIQKFHAVAFERVAEFLRFSGLRMESINFGELASEGDISGFTHLFEEHFGVETRDVEISLRTWFDFYATIGEILEPSFRFLCKEWDRTGESPSGMKPIDRKLKRVYDKTIDFLKLPTRTENALKGESIYHVGTLVSKSENNLLLLPNVGRPVLNDVKKALLANDLALLTDVGNWKPPEEK